MSILNKEELDLFSYFAADFKGRTSKDYMRELISFKKYLGKDLLEAGEVEARNYIKDLSSGLEGDSNDIRYRPKKSPGTILRIYHQLYGFYQFLYDNGYININPFRKVERPKATKQIRVERVPDFKDMELLLSTLERNFEYRDYLIALTIATTGLRISQVLNIKWSDFIIDDLNHIGVSIYDKKLKESRYIRILDVVWEKFNVYRESYLMVGEDIYRKDAYVFINCASLEDYRVNPEKVEPLSDVAVRTILTKACDMVNIKRITSKDLRHAHAIFSLKLGASVSEVKEQLGWSHSNFVYRYKGVIEQINSPANIYTESYFNSILDKEE